MADDIQGRDPLSFMFLVVRAAAASIRSGADEWEKPRVK
jgi:hypothetical protein